MMDSSTHPEWMLEFATDGWWACQQPERPYDAGTAYGDMCRPCLLHATVALAHGHGGTIGVHVDTGVDVGHLGTLAEYVAQATADLADHPAR